MRYVACLSIFMIVVACDADDQVQGTRRGGNPCSVNNDCSTGIKVVDMGDGTVMDSATSLIWQKTPPDQYMNYDNAVSYCDLNQGALPGTDWRLPTIGELRSLVRGCDSIFWNPKTLTGGECKIADGCLTEDCKTSACFVCSSDTGPGEEGRFIDVAFNNNGRDGFWSSSGVAHDIEGWLVSSVWLVFFVPGIVSDGAIRDDHVEGVRCVRTDIALP